VKKSKAETAATRKRIIEVASEAFRSRGIHATGVAEIMATAGLTHGGFYRHFDSKEQLITEALTLSLDELVAAAEEAADSGAGALLEHFQHYVSPEYRDNIAQTCPLAANGSELVRADEMTRRIASEGFKRIFATLARYIPAVDEDAATDSAIGIFTNMIGALTISRLVDDPALSDRILSVTRSQIARALRSPQSKEGPKRGKTDPRKKKVGAP